MKVIEYLMVTLVTFLILQDVYGHPQPLASNNSMISKPNADKKLDNQETESQKKEESNHETKDSIDKEKKEDEQQNLSQTYNKKEPNKGPKDSKIEKEVNDAVTDDILASQNAKVAIEKNSNVKNDANLQETQVMNDITPADKDKIAKKDDKADEKVSNSNAQITDKENKIGVEIGVEVKKNELKSSDIQADPTLGESESFKKLLELVHTIEGVLQSEIELRKLDKATINNLNEKVENIRDQLKVQNELKLKVEKLKNIEEKSNVEPKYNINGVAKVKTQEEEENIIKSVKNSEQNHEKRNQEESSSLFGFIIVGIILAVLFGLNYKRNLKKQRPYRYSDAEDDEIYKYYIGTKSK